MSGTDATREIVDSYSDAWMRGDVDEACEHLADDLRFRGSIDQFDRAQDFKAALAGFQQLVTNVNMIERFYDNDRAALLYDCVTETEAGTIRTAEFFRLANEKITEIRLVFDATVLRKLMGHNK